jgi:hypothetical protein
MDSLIARVLSILVHQRNKCQDIYIYIYTQNIRIRRPVGVDRIGNDLAFFIITYDTIASKIRS